MTINNQSPMMPPREDAIEPELPICDSHHHLWFPPNKRIYSPEDYFRDVGKGHNIVNTVFVESQSILKKTEQNPIEETRLVHTATDPKVTQQYGKTRVAAGIVGFADLTMGDAVRPILEAQLAASDRFHGIRQIIIWEDKSNVDIFVKGLASDKKFREGFAYLQKYNLTFDAMIFFNQLPELVDLAIAFPNSPIILNHMATGPNLGTFVAKEPELINKWKQNMAELSTCSNVYVKLGGAGMLYGPGNPVSLGSAQIAKDFAPFVHRCVELFGCSRCMFESNYPPESRFFSYDTVWNVFKHVTKKFSKNERADLFYNTAVKIYRI